MKSHIYLIIISLVTGTVFSESAAGQSPVNFHSARAIDAGQGRSAAVVVPGELPLLHTTQVFYVRQKTTPAKDQISVVFDRLAELLKKHGSDLSRVVKLNVCVTHDEGKASVLQQLPRLFPGKTPPAVTFVRGSLPVKGAEVAVDAVATLPMGTEFNVTMDAAVLVPGARVYVSGQAERGKSLAEATRKTLESLEATLKFLRLTKSDVVQYKAFLQPMAEAEMVRKEFARFHAGKVPPLVLVEWKSSLPIEIELIANAGKHRHGLVAEYPLPPGLKASPVFSRAARVNSGKLIYLSSLLGEGDSARGEILDIFGQLGKVLDKAGSDFGHLVKATYYVTSAEAVQQMGKIRPQFYDPKKPPAASLAMVPGVASSGVASPGRSVTLDMIAVPSPRKVLNEYGPAEYGAGLSKKQALAGWLSLFDGKTDFGWRDAKVENGILVGGTSTTVLGPCEFVADVINAGSLTIAGDKQVLKKGRNQWKHDGGVGAVQLDAAVRTLLVRPAGLKKLFNGKDLTGWKRIDHPRRPKETWPIWKVVEGAIRAEGGTGALEYQPGLFGDMILQVEIRTLSQRTNGGLFFRSQPGLFMMGYEAQIYNSCEAGDVGTPSVWATGAIDDRQNCRRLISRDGEPWVETVIAHGPHIATFVNGYQVVDWNDTRPPDENPRKGLRLHPGSLQLQSHDIATFVEFRQVQAADLK